MNIATQAVHIGLEWDTRTGAVTVPIYQTATFRHPGLGQSTGYDYSALGQPHPPGARGGHGAARRRRPRLRLLVGDGGHHEPAAALQAGRSPRRHRRSLRRHLPALRADLQAVRPDLHATWTPATPTPVRAAFRPDTRALFVESLTNPLLKIADIPALAALCRERGALCIVDNTFLTPTCCARSIWAPTSPSTAAASTWPATTTRSAGSSSSRTRSWPKRVYFHQNAAGAVLGPQDSWLIIRGLKTLGVRLDRQQENARTIAAWLGRPPARHEGLLSRPARRTPATS